MAKDDEIIWRTIGGRRIPIRAGQSLSEAMKESGKFKLSKKQQKAGEDLHKKGVNGAIEDIKTYLNGNKKDFDSDEEFKTELAKEWNLDKEEADNLFKNVSEKNKQEKMGTTEYLMEKQREKGNYKDDKANELQTKANKATESMAKNNIKESETKDNKNTIPRDFEKGYGKFKVETNSNKGHLDDRYEITKDEDGWHAKNLRTGETYATFRDHISNSDVFEFEKGDGGTKAETKSGNYRDSITNAAKDSKEDNVTLDVETGKPVQFEKGYSVSFQQSTDNYSDEEYDAKVQECKDKCDGKVYAGKYGGDAEASFHTDSLDDAKELMYKYNQESIYDWKHDTLIMNDRYDASKNKTNYQAETSNDIMNNAIREKVAEKRGKDSDNLPKKVEIKNQGTSNRKEVSENIQAHILEHYESPEAFIEQMDNMNEPTMWRAGETLAKGGSYLIYYGDQREFLDSLKINPKGKNFSDDRVFSTYTSLIGRESAKLYERLKRNAYKKYLKEHPGSEMSFNDFKDMKEGK